MSNPETIQYQTKGTCSQAIQLTILDNKIQKVEFFGGCNGNLKGISQLVIGLTIDDVIAKLKGITCGAKQTSCPDQLAQCLIEYKERKSVAL